VNITAINLVILVSAIWRLCSLVANEDGPFLIFDRIRRLALRLTRRSRFFGALHFYQGLVCEWCNSIWFAVPAAVAWWYFGDVVLLAALPLALSAWVIVLKYAVRLLQNAEEYYYARKEPEVSAWDGATLKITHGRGVEEDYAIR
jgi:hypothetical protein